MNEHLQDARQLGKYLSVTVNQECYGVPVLRVKEIIEHGGVVHMPLMPGFVCGAINLRGHGVPVVDLAQRLGTDHAAIGKRSCIVIVEAGESPERRYDAGLLVDAVNEVFDLDASQIEAAPSFDGHVRTDFLRGMGKRGDGFIVLLELDNILDLSDIESFHDSMAGARSVSATEPFKRPLSAVEVCHEHAAA
jgi:purine-binding chemotaxis protein CheW